MLKERNKKLVIGMLLASCLLLSWSNVLVRALDEHAQAGSPPAVMSGNQVWISSVPFGLNVYVMSLDAAPSKAVEDRTQVLDTHDIFKPQNLKGTTPFLLKGLAKGWIMIGVKPVTWMTREGEIRALDPTLDCIYILTPLQKMTWQWFNDYRKGIGELDGGVVYDLEIDPQRRRYITILAIDISSDLAEMEKQYPAEAHFSFDDDAAMQTTQESLGGTGIFPAEEKAKFLAMAHRGGKVVIPKGVIRIVLDVEDHDKFRAAVLKNDPKK